MYVRLKGLGITLPPIRPWPKPPRQWPPVHIGVPRSAPSSAMGDVCSVDRYGNRVCGPSMSMGVVTPTSPLMRNPIVRSILPTAPVAPGSNAILANRTFLQETAANRVAVPNGSTINIRVGPVQPYLPPWGGWNQQYGSGQGTTQQTGIMATDLANLISIYQSNPAALTQAQWTTMQNAGLIPSTLPYSSASSLAPGAGLPGASSATASSTYTPTASPDTSASGGSLTDFLSTQYGPLTGVEWLGVAAVGYFLFMKKGR